MELSRRNNHRLPKCPATHNLRNKGRRTRLSVECLENRRLLASGFEFQQLATQPTGNGYAMPGTPADYNGDGVLDLVSLNHGQGTVNVFLGRGDGDLELKTTFSSQGAYPSFSAPGDFDSDGYLDVAVTNYGSSNIAIFRGDGLGNFEFKRTLSLTSAFGLVSRDFDGDGKLDLAVGQYSQGGLSVFKGDGLGGFETPTFYATGSNPYHVTSADMDQDGAQDLLVANYSSNNVSILYGLKGNDGVPMVSSARSSYWPRHRIRTRSRLATSTTMDSWMSSVAVNPAASSASRAARAPALMHQPLAFQCQADRMAWPWPISMAITIWI